LTAHEIVIRLGRPFDVQFRGEHGGVPFAFSTTSEITVPFADRESAEAAQRDITVSVRPVRDAGGEDYRPVVSGEVLPADAGFEAAIREQEARMRASIIAPKPDLGDLRGGSAASR
jgi:hypothetical protein